MTDTPKRLGRPPLTPGDTPTRLHVTVPSADYDRAASIARRDDCSVAEVFRRGLRRLAADDTPAD